VFVYGRFGSDQQPTLAQPDVRSERGDDGPELAPQAIASRGWADRAADREGDAQRDRRGIVEKGAPQGLGSGRTTATCQRLERPSSADPPDQAESRVRPLSRLALMIARPARVRMRARKPCLRARRRVLGWNVRFTDSRPSRTFTTNGQAPRPVDQQHAAQASGRRRSLNAPRLEPRRIVQQPMPGARLLPGVAANSSRNSIGRRAATIATSAQTT
jgi:hypothetical protein